MNVADVINSKLDEMAVELRKIRDQVTASQRDIALLKDRMEEIHQDLQVVGEQVGCEQEEG